MLIIGDFNLDQLLPEHVVKVGHLIQIFNLSQLSQYSPHIHEGISNRVFITSNSSNISSFRHPTVITLFFFSKSEGLYLYRI